MGRCLVCEEPMPDDRLLHHLEVVHPQQYGDGPEAWPDGAPVVVDTTLGPADFEGADG